MKLIIFIYIFIVINVKPMYVSQCVHIQLSCEGKEDLTGCHSNVWGVAEQKAWKTRKFFQFERPQESGYIDERQIPSLANRLRKVVSVGPN